LLVLGLFLGMGCEGRHSDSRDAAVDAVIKDAPTPPGDVSLDGNRSDRPLDRPFDRDLRSPSDGDEGDSVVESTDGGIEDAPNLEVAGACGRSSWALVGHVPNVRQLGGLPLMNGGTVACDLVYRGSSLSSLIEDGCSDFVATGIKTVIDIRSESEQTSPPAACAIEQARLVSAPLPTPYNLSPADYLADLYTAPSMRAVFELLANRAAYPVYYHCLYGKDRTGVVTAVILTALGASRQVIQEDYVLSREAGFSITPPSLDAVLDELDRIGVDAYFRTIGVPAEQVEAMRRILTSP
jgi:protein-tyrosine phosphatase